MGKTGDHLCQKKKKVALLRLNFFVVADFSFEYWRKTVNAYICSSFTTNERQFACHSNCLERLFSLNAYTQR